MLLIFLAMLWVNFVSLFSKKKNILSLIGSNFSIWSDFIYLFSALGRCFAIKWALLEWKDCLHQPCFLNNQVMPINEIMVWLLFRLFQQDWPFHLTHCTLMYVIIDVYIKRCIFSSQISSSFDSMDPFGTGQVLPPLQVPHPTAQDTIIPPLKKPPKWVRRPVGASFAVRKTFGCHELKEVRG